MANFGKYAIVSAATHHFENEPDWWWKINPVDSGMELEMSKFLAHKRSVFQGRERVEMPPTWLEIAFREIALTFGGANIPATDTPVEEGGEPLFKDDMSVEGIEAILTSMPRAMLMEIWKAVGEAYPMWGPSDPNAV